MLHDYMLWGYPSCTILYLVGLSVWHGRHGASRCGMVGMVGMGPLRVTCKERGLSVCVY
jgi:hypothetical protein